MDKKKIGQIRQQYDLVIHNAENADIEFWYARELMPLLGYDRWENFDRVVCRAMESCETSGVAVSDHFREVTKMVELELGSGAQRSVKDYMLTRYACYLIAQNGDPKKEEIAFAQSYFAVQTRFEQNNYQSPIINYQFNNMPGITGTSILRSGTRKVPGAGWLRHERPRRPRYCGYGRKTR